ncbi:MAG: HIT domain-containing protein [Candidatus Marinimicrobia bacterium]|nr:HIT domain-containing protein [Candidatus Neomarinimicrobiota bacterium]
MNYKTKRLWSPWRMEYVKREKEKGCIFCNKIKANNDEENLILFRGKYSFIIMNLYPYNNGHIMIVPNRHIADYELLTSDERKEISDLTNSSIKIMKKNLKPGGFNIGMNIGSIGGAGIEHHIHQHIVPRWNGDTNFMPVVGHTKVMPDALQGTYNDLKNEFINLKK